MVQGNILDFFVEMPVSNFGWIGGHQGRIKGRASRAASRGANL